MMAKAVGAPPATQLPRSAGEFHGLLHGPGPISVAGQDEIITDRLSYGFRPPDIFGHHDISYFELCSGMPLLFLLEGSFAHPGD